MPYKISLEELKRELSNRQTMLTLFLQTNANIYSFRSALNQEQELDIINPISEVIREKEYRVYDALQRQANTIYYISRDMVEYQSLNNILNLNEQLENDEVDRATIRSIETDKIKMIIFKKGRFMFLYKYNSGKLFKQGWKARFNDEEAIVEKEDNNILLLSKLVPDIIVDLQCEIIFVLNIVQAEYILQIDRLFTGTIREFANNLRDFNLMKEDTINSFINEVNGKSNHMRKLHKIQTTQSYRYFQQNIDKIPEVSMQYGLDITFDDTTGQIIFNEETNVGDVLHLFADDYIRRHISERDDVI